METSYSQPTELWTLTRGAEIARAVFVPHKILSTLVVFRNGNVDSVEDVSEWTAAIECAEAMRRLLLDQGWQERG